MEITTDEYEKLGAFYLGREYDLGKKELRDDLVLYDSKDLVTHGVVLGMTGSGKTGLSLAILEEAAIDGIPAIIIDPKGDIANLMLTFPEFDGASFRPWINEDDAQKKGMTPDEFAQGQADLWKKGLGSWGQTGERVEKFQDAVDINVFTPGSSAGIPVSILSSLEAPPFEIVDDAELFGDRIESTVSSLLTLLDIDADPIQSQEHILLSNIFAHYWSAEEGVTLEKLIVSIQQPPFDKVGVLGLESFYPEKKRAALAMQMNNLLAAPRLQGVAARRAARHQEHAAHPRGQTAHQHLFDRAPQRHRAHVFRRLAAQPDAQLDARAERHLVVARDALHGRDLRLPAADAEPAVEETDADDAQAGARVRPRRLARHAEPGRSRLQGAVQHGDVVPRPPADRARQDARARWPGGRSLDAGQHLRPRRDGGDARRARQPGVFAQQCARGRTGHVPCALGHVLPARADDAAPDQDPDGSKKIRAQAGQRLCASWIGQRDRRCRPPERRKAEEANAEERDLSKPPAVSAKIPQMFLPVVADDDDEIVYLPAIIRSAEVYISDAKMNIDGKRTVSEVTKFSPRDEAVDWDVAVPYEGSVRNLPESPDTPCQFTELPGFAIEEKNYEEWGDDYVDHLYRTGGGITVFHMDSLNAYSKPGESEADFRIRLQGAAREKRDELVEKLRVKYGKLIDRMESKLDTAIDKLEEQKAQASSAKMNTAVNIGTSILGALFGRKRMTTAMRSGSTSTSRAMREARQAKAAKEQVEKLQADLAELEEKLRAEIEEARDSIDPMTEPLEHKKVKVLKRDIDLKLCGLAWLPYHRASEFELQAAWR